MKLEDYEKRRKFTAAACLCCMRILTERLTSEESRKELLSVLGDESVASSELPTEAQLEPVDDDFMTDDEGFFDIFRTFVQALGFDMFEYISFRGFKADLSAVRFGDRHDRQVALYCMDYVLRALGGYEEAFMFWLENGVPDDAFTREHMPTEKQVRTALEADIPRKEFYRRTSLFSRIFIRDVYHRDDIMTMKDE